MVTGSFRVRLCNGVWRHRRKHVGLSVGELVCTYYMLAERVFGPLDCMKSLLSDVLRRTTCKMRWLDGHRVLSCLGA